MENDSDRQIIVHVGASKCGSSAIQTFLRKHQTELLEQNIYVPPTSTEAGAKVTGEHVWYFQHFCKSPEASRDIFRRDIEYYFELKSEVRTLLFSAENLTNPNGLSQLFEPSNIPYPVKIIAYIRRQDDYLESAWQQWECKVRPDFSTWLASELGSRANWRIALEPWVNAIGRNNMVVKRYIRSLLYSNDVVEDFSRLIGFKGVIKPINARESNPSLNEGFTKLLELSRSLHENIHDARLYNAVVNLTGNRHVKQSFERRLSGTERQALLDRFSASNNWCRDMFFEDLADQGKPLFELTEEELKNSNISEEDRTRQMFTILADMIITLNERISERNK